ncbi:E3 ubiquitin-protein ligase RNF220 [Musca domestica]|uniref:E3 ubiquitin-protein ligase RNF220 n=1 Tax=Musca domestica TaxID=7370 RepID=A0A1I8MIV5_MUSDO|nr:E3 ubiquitin-protein ligase RNF220 [Musca domestica]
MAAAQTPRDLITTTTTTPAATTTTNASIPSSSSSTTISLLAPENGGGGGHIECPNCDKKLLPHEVAGHVNEEMQRLKQTLPITTRTTMVALRAASEELFDRDEESTTSSGNDGGTTTTSERRKPWSVFQRVQRNRQSRMRRNRKRPVLPEHPCPVCNVSFPQDEIQQHAEECLRRSNRTANGRSNSDDHSSNEDDPTGEEYEEYEWAGQKRIRVSSLLQGGYAAIGIGQTITNGSSAGGSSNRLNGQSAAADDDEEDLNVDEDDTHIYGPSQYAENDVIPSHIMDEDESDVTSYMRRLITAGTSQTCTARTTNTTTTDSLQHLNSSSAILKNNNDISIDNLLPTAITSTTPSILSTASLTSATSSASSPAVDLLKNDQEPKTPAQYQQIIDSLKAKLRHYEQQYIPGKYKCLICLDDYRNPAISVACWHVHCEQCWLRSLGARKLCPQCNLITTPKDLRRIYM